jgi:Tripartite tricarboxylate transporter TctB family
VRPNLLGSDLPLALLLIAISGASIWSASDLQFGTFTRMGPGFIPIVLAGILLFLAVLILIQGLMTHTDKVRYAVKPLLLILGSLAFMAFALERLGLVICIPVVVVISSLAQGRVSWRPVAALSVFLSVFCYVLFIWALGLPIPAFPV